MTKKDSPVPTLAKSCGSSGKLALVALTHRTPANVAIRKIYLALLFVLFVLLLSCTEVLQ